MACGRTPPRRRTPSAAGCAAQKIGHAILTWDRRDLPPPGSGLQAAAREARYRLLCGHCRALGILHLALAHQRDDQAETFLLRLGRGSGLDGLAGMAPVTERDGVRLLRPLLPVPRGRLAATLQSWGQDWIDDPTNENTAHTRIRLRRLLPSLAEAGVTAERLWRKPPRPWARRGQRWTRPSPVSWRPGPKSIPPAISGLTPRPRRRASGGRPAGAGPLPDGHRRRRLYAALRAPEPALRPDRRRPPGVRGDLGRLPDPRQKRTVADLPGIRRRPVPPSPSSAGASQVWDGRFAVTLARSRGADGPCPGGCPGS